MVKTVEYEGKTYEVIAPVKKVAPWLPREVAMKKLGFANVQLFRKWAKENNIAEHTLNSKHFYLKKEIKKAIGTLRNQKVSGTLLKEFKDQLNVAFEKHMEAAGFGEAAKVGSNIYLIINEMSGLVKIGISENVTNRLRQLRNASGFDLKLIASAYITTIDVSFFENFLHRYYEQERKIGEWFALSEAEVKEIIKLFKRLNCDR